jgi:hypothetical protein
LEINLADLIGYSIHIFSVQKLNKDSFTFIEQICLRCNYGHWFKNKCKKISSWMLEQ